MDARAAARSTPARFPVTEMNVGEALHRIAQITRDAVPAAEIVGMSMLGDDGRPASAVYTDDQSPAIDEAQYREGRGPCLDAWRENAVFRITGIEDCADRYPAFAAACVEHGVHSTLSLPMTAGDVAVGAMNLCRASQRENVKLRHIAARIVERRGVTGGGKGAGG